MPIKGTTEGLSLTTPFSSVVQSYHKLADEIVAAMSSRELASEDRFNDLALRIFRFQWDHNIAYRNFCQRHGATDPSVWQEILPIPTDAFKIDGLAIFCFPVQDAAKVFLTSGTTKDHRGRHYFHDTKLYEAAILHGWGQLPRPSHSLMPYVLTPSPSVAPQSSLSHMMGVLAGEDDDRFYVCGDGALQDERLRDDLANATEPVLLLGTALAFLHWFEAMGDGRLCLPEGSWVMETGGYKGTGREMTKEALYGLFEDHLGVAADQLVNEYSMTELSSQFYSRGLNAPHWGPSWTRTQVLDPETQTPAETGYLTIVDLANVGSCLAIATQDLARQTEHGFELLGRDPKAIARGCSRAADAMLSGWQRP